MDNTFIFGTSTFGVNFTDREQESKRLITNFQNRINTIIISPRRWGKTSLVRKVSEQINNQNGKLIVVNIDAFLCRSEEDFYKLFSTEIIKQTTSKWEEWLQLTKKFLSRLSPKLNIGTDPINDFSISFDIITDPQSVNDILNLPQKIAEDKKVNIVVCIDEFQQLAEFHDSKSFQKKLRSIWQLQTMVSYCLYGSKMHLMSALFSKQSMPFYKFGDLIFLQKISENDWIEYICSRFQKTGKTISSDIASLVCKTVECHSSYVQQLSWLVWTRTVEVASLDQFKESVDDLLNQNGILYYKTAENLSYYQLNFLKALTDGIDTEFSKAEIIKKYDLGSSANVNRLKKSLEQKEVIDIVGKKVYFLDPIFKLWLKRQMHN